MATKKQQTDFINMIGPLAQKVCYERGYGNAQIWTCIAQACCESAYGTSNLMKKANAFFGVKAPKSWKGLVYNTKTREVYSGQSVVITDQFKAFSTPLESVEDYYNLLASKWNKHYNKSLKQNTVKDCITEIKLGGYATAPNYVSTICSFYNSNKADIEKFKVDHIELIQPEKKSNEEIAKEVINGNWGTGIDRRKRLTEAGYDYFTIQSIVNNMLKSKK